MSARATVLGLVPPVLGLAAWIALGDTSAAASPLFVSPGQVLHALAASAAEGQLWAATSASLLRYLIGLGIGVVVGLAAGLLLGLSRAGRLLLQPTLRVLQQISLFAWVPLIMAWFGLDETSKIVFIALAAFFPVLVNTLEGVRGVPVSLVEVGRIYAFSRLQLLWRVILPSALPSVFSGVFLALIYAWLATLGAEYLLTQGQGIGSLLVEAQDQYRTDQVVVGLLLVCAISLLLNAAVDRLQAYLSRWRISA
jgi:sulfonate transport system permease protein